MAKGDPDHDGDAAGAPEGPRRPEGDNGLPPLGELRPKLALALDVDDMVVAIRLSRQLAPWFGVAKIGLELFSAAGPDAVATVAECGYHVFLDLKLLDIPTTVRKAARVLGGLGASYLTVHAVGGTSVLTAAVDGLSAGASSAGSEPPAVLAVTILTSDSGAPPHVLGARVAAAEAAGCGGVVCAASDAAEAKALAPRLLAVVPGIRPSAGPRHDQARTATPKVALAAGADMLVIGRAVTEADDPPAAATALFGKTA
jgi:orotidine-5'-phosphate decarboxylase